MTIYGKSRSEWGRGTNSFAETAYMVVPLVELDRRLDLESGGKRNEQY